MSEALEQKIQEARPRRFRPYPEYKDSGVEWLGEVPEHWTVAPVYARYDVALGKMLDAARVSGEHSGRYIRNVDVQWDAVNTADLPEMDFPLSERERYRLRPGDLLVCEGGEVGRAAIWTEHSGDFFYQKAIHRVRPRSVEDAPRFLYYLFYALAKRGVFVAGGNPNTIDHLTAVQLKHYRLPFATLGEQRAIAAFLDRETAKIDGLVARKERLIALLQEKRSALITRVVTQGLDPNVPMKDSGVEWLGEIPAHWAVLRVRDIAHSLQTGPFGSQLHADDYVKGGVPVINPSDLAGGALIPDVDASVAERTAVRLARHRLLPGDILFARRGELGRCGLVEREQEGWLCGTGCLRLRPNPALTLPGFLLRLLSIAGVRDWLALQSVGSTMQNLNTSIIGRLPLCIPPVEEQDAITSKLARDTTRLDHLVREVMKAIEFLKEFRAALISTAVTGKIDVREEVS